MTITVKFKKAQPRTYKNVVIIKNKTLYKTNDYLQIKEKDDKHDGIFLPMCDIYGFEITNE